MDKQPKYLPEGLTIKILGCLPVKDLLRFRSVSKTWCSLIDGHYFIKEHLMNSMINNSNIWVVHTDGKNFYWFDRVDIPNPNPNLNPDPNDPVELDGIRLRAFITFLGSCDGLLAVMNTKGHITILNPFTKRYWELPLTVSIPVITNNGVLEIRDDTYCGFGCDPINDVYKFVILKISGDIAAFKVYSAKSNTFSASISFNLNNNGCSYHRGTFYGVLASNALHWVVHRVLEPVVQTVILAFDLVTEQLYEVPKPDYTEVGLLQLKLADLGGSLSLVCMYKDPNQVQPNNQLHRVEIWVMNNYGFRESWARLFVVLSSQETGPLFCVTPVAYFDNGRKVLLVNHEHGLIMHDLQTRRSTNNLIIPGVPQGFKPHQGILCVASLVRLKNF